MPAPLPTALNLIFHGPWGFVLDANSITAVTPACASHVYFLGDTPLLNGLPAGRYRFQNEAAVAPLPDPQPPSPPQTTVAGAVSLPAAAGLRMLQLPRTALHAGRRAQRACPTAPGGDNLITGPSFSRLNCSAAEQPVYLAVNQILPYSIRSIGDLGIVSATGLAWRPSLNFTTARASINLHIFGQTISTTATHDHFSAMAALFGLDLRLDGSQAKTAGTDYDPNLPAGITPDELADLGAAPTPLLAPRTVLVPIICGGNLVMTAG